MKRQLKLIWKMVRIAKPWEWATVILTVVFLVLTLAPGFFHIPRLLASFLTIPTIIGCFGIWFVLDLLYARAEHAQ